MAVAVREPGEGLEEGVFPTVAVREEEEEEEDEEEDEEEEDEAEAEDGGEVGALALMMKRTLRRRLTFPFLF